MHKPYFVNFLGLKFYKTLYIFLEVIHYRAQSLGPISSAEPGRHNQSVAEGALFPSAFPCFQKTNKFGK